MKYIHNVIILFALVFISTVSCAKIKNEVYSNAHYYIQFLGINVDSIPLIANYEKHLNIEFGDEGLSWRSLYFFNEGKHVLTMETDWQDTVHISRISIYSEEIQIDNVHPGDKIKKVTKPHAYSIEPCQDGFLLLKHNYCKGVFLEVDISDVSPTSELWRGECKIEEIPDSLCIKCIILSQ